MTEKREDPVVELEKAHEHWQDIYENGCYDPLYADGINLNLVRNHMLYYMRMIEDQYGNDEKPAVYDKPIPEKVDVHYMAKMDEILNKAEALNQRFSQMQEVHDLLRAQDCMSDKELDDLHCSVDFNRIQDLKEAIQTLDYVRMRALSVHPEVEIENVLKAHESLMNRRQEEGEQISLFEMTM